MKIDLCKLLGVEEGEEFIVEFKDGHTNDCKYRVMNNIMEWSERETKYDGDYNPTCFSLNDANKVKNIIKLPKKKQFTDNELYILNNIDKKYKWIAKDKSGLICTFVSKPIKTEKLWSDDGWSNGESYASLEAIKNSLFTEIKWEDEEPVFIDEYVER